MNDSSEVAGKAKQSLGKAWGIGVFARSFEIELDLILGKTAQRRWGGKERGT